MPNALLHVVNEGMAMVSKYGPARDGEMQELGRVHAGLVRTVRQLDLWAAWNRSSKPCLDLLPEQIIRTPSDS